MSKSLFLFHGQMVLMLFEKGDGCKLAAKIKKVFESWCRWRLFFILCTNCARFFASFVSLFSNIYHGNRKNRGKTRKRSIIFGRYDANTSFRENNSRRYDIIF
jgi:hypothetical protein